MKIIDNEEYKSNVIANIPVISIQIYLSAKFFESIII